MDSLKEDFAHLETVKQTTTSPSINYYKRTSPPPSTLPRTRPPLPQISTTNPHLAEPSWSHLIPGGYSSSRCLRLRGRPMIGAIFALSGCAIMFFGYDTAVMSQVNTNANYLGAMGLAGGSERDAAGIGGMVSLWFGGFAVGMFMFFPCSVYCYL